MMSVPTLSPSPWFLVWWAAVEHGLMIADRRPACRIGKVSTRAGRTGLGVYKSRSSSTPDRALQNKQTVHNTIQSLSFIPNTRFIQPTSTATMHYQTIALAFALSAVGLAQDVDRDDIPQQCVDICQPIVTLTQNCDNSTSKLSSSTVAMLLLSL